MGVMRGTVSGALAQFLPQAAGASAVKVADIARLSGGAIQEHWSFDAEFADGPLTGKHALVLRTEAASSIAATRPIAEQFALLQAARGAGVPVPEPLWLCAEAGAIRRPFFIMRRLNGVALGSKIVKGEARPRLALELAAALARIHTIRPPRADLAFLGPPPARSALAAIAAYRAALDREPEPHPAIEWGLRRLERAAPAEEEIVLCHRDFRTGNYLAEGERLMGVLDWEFAGWGDPHEDLGWFCAKCWRFGAIEREAGGIAAREIFLAAYERVSGRAVDAARVRSYELMAHVRWAVIALDQARRHRSGAEASLELALIGRRLAELDYEIIVHAEAAPEGPGDRL